MFKVENILKIMTKISYFKFSPLEKLKNEFSQKINLQILITNLDSINMLRQTFLKTKDKVNQIVFFWLILHRKVKADCKTSISK